MSESKGACGGRIGMTIPTLPVRWLYRLASTNAFSERGLYLNLGYWPEARTIDEACEAMVDSPIRKIVVEMGQMLGSIRQLQLLKLQQALLDWSRQLKELI